MSVYSLWCTFMTFTSLQRALLLTIAPLSALVLSGCGALKFYPGEERADSTIGRLLFNSQGAELSAVTIDGTPHPHPGRTVELLPGPHEIEVKYIEDFGISDSSAPNGDRLVSYGSCELKFSLEATQELFVYVDAGSHPHLGSSIPPTITLKEQGYDKPALFQERCHEEGRQANAKITY